jgi:hypothetical protein
LDFFKKVPDWIFDTTKARTELLQPFICGAGDGDNGIDNLHRRIHVASAWRCHCERCDAGMPAARGPTVSFFRLEHTATPSCGWCLPSGSHTIKSLSLFQIENNQISQDVKGLFLGHRFVWSRVIVKVPMLQLEDELLEKGHGNVRC